MARSAFVSENVQNTSVSDHFLHFPCSVSQSCSQSVSIKVFTSSIGVRVRRYWFVLGGPLGGVSS